eukprot:jgi/Botrbrau1/12850/Bobra.0045s0019.1
MGTEGQRFPRTYHTSRHCPLARARPRRYAVTIRTSIPCRELTLTSATGLDCLQEHSKITERGYLGACPPPPPLSTNFNGKFLVFKTPAYNGRLRRSSRPIPYSVRRPWGSSTVSPFQIPGSCSGSFSIHTSAINRFSGANR